jgi:hypothetical protein
MATEDARLNNQVRLRLEAGLIGHAADRCGFR